MSRDRAYHPILFALFGALFLHGYFTHELMGLILHLVLLLIGTFIINRAVRGILKNVTKAAYITTLVVVLYIAFLWLVRLFPHTYLVLEESRIFLGLAVIPAWCFLLYYGVTHIIKSRREIEALPKYLNWLAASILTIQLLYGGYRLISTGYRSSCLDLPGDANNDGNVNISDVVYIRHFVFQNGPPPPCLEEGNCNGDRMVNIGDAIYLEQYIFYGGPAPIPGESQAEIQ
jgi:hypothetical protein